MLSTKKKFLEKVLKKINVCSKIFFFYNIYHVDLIKLGTTNYYPYAFNVGISEIFKVLYIDRITSNLVENSIENF